MTDLQGFEDAAREAILDQAEAYTYGERGNLAYTFLKTANDNFRDYANRHDYDLDSVIESGQVTETDRSNRSVSATVEWTNPLTGLFEYGTPEHTIDGDPILSFVWEDPPGWVKDEFNQARDTGGRFQSGWRVFFHSVEHPGMPEARAIRGALNYIRFQYKGATSL